MNKPCRNTQNVTILKTSKNNIIEKRLVAKPFVSEVENFVKNS